MLRSRWAMCRSTRPRRERGFSPRCAASGCRSGRRPSVRRPALQTPVERREIRQMLKYTRDHEWVRVDGDVGTVGITPFAQEKLGDLVFVELPNVGATFDQGQTACTVESVKAAADVFAPVSGEVVEVNERGRRRARPGQCRPHRRRLAVQDQDPRCGRTRRTDGRAGLRSDRAMKCGWCCRPRP